MYLVKNFHCQLKKINKIVRFHFQEFIQAQMLAKVVETPQKSLRRETRESSAKRGVDDLKRKRDDREEKTPKRRKV